MNFKASRERLFLCHHEIYRACSNAGPMLCGQDIGDPWISCLDSAHLHIGASKDLRYKCKRLRFHRLRCQVEEELLSSIGPDGLLTRQSALAIAEKSLSMCQTLEGSLPTTSSQPSYTPDGHTSFPGAIRPFSCRMKDIRWQSKPCHVMPSVFLDEYLCIVFEQEQRLMVVNIVVEGLYLKHLLLLHHSARGLRMCHHFDDGWLHAARSQHFARGERDFGTTCFHGSRR